jgi:membrane fusion protein (multidrug efflux system)
VEVTGSGVVEARRTVDVAFQVGGKVTAVGPDEGDRTRAGSFLAQIDPTDYRLAASQAEIASDRAAAEFLRHDQMFKRGAFAPSDHDRSRAEAGVAQASATLAVKKLTDTRLVAPIAGDIARRAIELGETAVPGVPVYTILDIDPADVRIGVAESDIGRIAVGHEATVRLTAGPQRTFAGRVRLVGIAADPTTRTFLVTIAVPNPDRALKAGMVAEATIVLADTVRAVTLPVEALARDPEGASIVYLYDHATRRVRAQRVSVSIPRGREVEILDGVGPKSWVVVAGQQRLRDGLQVRLNDGGAERRP